MAIEWDAGLATGVQEIDDQHQELFRRLDALLQAIRGGGSREEVARTLAYLVDHVDRHFAAEEALMAGRAIPALEEHRREHQAFSAQLEVLREEHGRVGPTARLVLRVNTELTAWLRSHIFRTDRALADWLAANP
ncbi:MAG TPA: bacteriohemerythrin [Anaeromyxobacteraceae bacterium]|jgi:hemerythrin